MKKMKKVISLIMIAAVLASVIVVGTISPAASGTGVGLASWAMRAYNEGWSYSWGGASVGAVDCSGLIYSYCGGNRTSMLADAQANGRDWGYVSNGIPNVHGLGLSRPGHVGVYVGNGMEVDARGTGYGVCYQAVGSSWSCWFKLTAVSYPTTGWQEFNGSYYYYENGEYLANTSREIDGVTYYFSSSGASSTTPSNTSGSSVSTSSSASSASNTAAQDNGPLKKGSKGEKVKKLQSRLQELGYYNGLIDGDFGDLTETAFKLFQKQAGLYVDGIAGSDADILYSDDAPYYTPEPDPTEAVDETPAQSSSEVRANNRKSDLASTGAEEDEQAEEEQKADKEEEKEEISYSIGDSDEKIVTIQERLIKLGYLDGEADGAFGTMTEAAVKGFQSNNRLEETGKVDQKTYDTLFSSAAVKNAIKADDDTAEPEEAAPVSPIAATTTASSTVVEKTNSQISSKAVASVSDSIGAAKLNTNLEFILWLAIMIVVLLIAFAIVYAVQKKKARAMAYAGRHFM